MNEKRSIFEKIEEFNKVNAEIRRKIKLLYIFKVRSEEIEIILITNEGKVYCVGHNWKGVLGFGHDLYIGDLTINKEFIDSEQIVEFKNSECHTIARTSDGKLLCWGNNSSGCLGNGRVDYKTYKPELNERLINETIIDMCCGYRHTLVLTSNKEVYAWGANDKGQIGNNSNVDVVSTPSKIIFKDEKVDAISCGSQHSMVLTERGSVYIWGSNSYGQLGLNNASMSSFQITNQRKHQESEPKCIQIGVKIEKISCGYAHSILLTPEKEIFTFGLNKYKQFGLKTDEEIQFTPIKLNHSDKFIEIASHYNYNISAALSDRNLCYIWGNWGTKEVISESKSFYEIFMNYLQITHKTWNFSDEIVKEMIERREFSYNGRYRYEFEQKDSLGSGSFGKVYKVFNLWEEQFYAMKIIDLSASYFQGKLGMENSKKECLKEVRVMVKLKSDYVVHYINSWIEYENLFYIQMELCYKTLNEVLKQMHKDFSRKQNEILSPIEYYISSELFKETLEALKYLHEQKPQIIHRDLNTANILITKGINGRFVKLADFGLAVFHNFKSELHTSFRGNHEYMAPEVKSGRHYNTKSDVYSLGFTTQELFNIDIEPFKNIPIDDPLLEERYKTVHNFILDMMDPLKDKRPDCEQLLISKDSWYLDWNAIESDSIEQMLQELSLSEQSIEKSFHNYFIKTKLKL